MKIQFFFTGIARVFAALGGIAFNSFVGRTFGPEGLGIIGLCQTILFGLAVFGKCGLDRVMIRFIATCKETLYIPYLIRGIFYIFLSCLLTSITFYLLLSYGLISFSASNLNEALPWFLCTLFPFSICYLFSGLFKGLKWITLGCLMEQGIVGGIATIILSALVISGYRVTIENCAQAYLTGTIIVMLMGCFISKISLFKKQEINLVSSFKKSKNSEFDFSCLNITILSIFGFGLNLGGVLIAGFLLSTQDIGYFRAAERLCLMTSFVLAVINSIYPPRFAKAWASGDIILLRRYLKQAQALSLSVAVPITILLILFPTFFMGLMLNKVDDVSYVLQITALSSLANAASGPVGNVLTMTGHEKRNRNIIAFVSILGLIIYPLMMQYYGLFGAVVSYAFVSILSNLLMFVAVYKIINDSILNSKIS